MDNMMRWCLLLLLGISPGCDRWGVCDDKPWKTWCEDGKVMGCDQDPGIASFGSLVEAWEICGEQGMTCMEQFEEAACVHADRPCGADQEGLCRGRQHVTCMFGFESAAEDCGAMSAPGTGREIAPGSGFCVEADSGLRAGCSVVDSVCPVGGETRCHPLNYDDGSLGSAKLTCSSGLWTLTESCPENTECIAMITENNDMAPDAGADGGGADTDEEVTHVCALSDKPCPPNADSLCDGQQIGRCDEQGYAIVAGDCDDEEICAELENPDGIIEAYCLLSREPCPEGAHAMCVDNVVGHCDRTGYPEKQRFDADCSKPGMDHPADAICVTYGNDARCEPTD